MKTVFVVGGDPLVEEMFRSRGYCVTNQEGWYLETHPANLICFTGGGDVNPELYGEKPNGARHWNDKRDIKEHEIYVSHKGKVPMVGICRGGQLLNVLNGGKMIQDLGEYLSGDVVMCGSLYRQVRVDHHQGMLSGRGGEILAYYEEPGVSCDYIIWYPETSCLCFQPHPEWGHKGTEDLFFNLIKEYIGDEG